MICPNCGMELDDSERVCSLCGYEFETSQEETEVVENTAEVYEQETEELYYDESEMPIAEAYDSAPVSEQKPKKSKAPLIIIAVVIVGIIIAVVIFFMSKQSDNHPKVSTPTAMNSEEVTEAVVTEITTTDVTTTITTTTTVQTTTEVSTTTEAEHSFEKTGYVKISDGFLNVRKGPSASADKLGTLENNTAVTIIGDTGDWYEIDFNGQTGYVSIEFISLTAPTSDNESTSSEYVYLDNGLLRINPEIFDFSYDDLCQELGVSLPTPQSFPWWGVDLQNVDYTYNGIPLCFMFQYGQLVMVIYDIESEFQNDVCDRAYDTFGVAEYPHYWIFNDYSTFEILLDTYAEDGTTHFKQQYTSNDMLLF